MIESQPTTKYHADVCSLPTPQWDGKDNEKNSKTHGLRYEQFNWKLW